MGDRQYPRMLDIRNFEIREFRAPCFLESVFAIPEIAHARIRRHKVQCILKRANSTYRNSGIMKFWNCGILEFAVLVSWNTDISQFANCGIIEAVNSQTPNFGNVGILEFRYFGIQGTVIPGSWNSGNIACVNSGKLEFRTP